MHQIALKLIVCCLVDSKNDSSTGTYSILLKNVATTHGLVAFGRTFQLDAAQDFDNVVQASFFDVGDDVCDLSFLVN